MKILEKLKLGNPWKIPKPLIVVIPILRHKYGRRNYRLIQEAEDKIEIKDSGSISKATIRNKTDTPIFIRKGTLLKGQTQERGVAYGIIILPEIESEIEVRCVHASKPIRIGANLRPSKHLAPRAVMTAFYARSPSQSHTWSMASYATSAMSRLSSQSYQSGIDDLVGALETTKFKEDIEKILEKIPADLEDQVGIAIIDLKGVVGVEIFNHPDSWKALSKSVIRHYADILTEETSDLFDIKIDKAKEVLMKFFEKIRKSEKEKVHEYKNTATYMIKGKNIVGEYTTLNNKTIHLIASRTEHGLQKRQTSYHHPLSVISNQIPTEPPYSYKTPKTWFTELYAKETNWFYRKGSYHLLESISKKPKTWKDLERNLDISTRTLAKRIKEAETLGLINRKPRITNGRTTYILTNKGKETLKKAKNLFVT